MAEVGSGRESEGRKERVGKGNSSGLSAKAEFRKIKRSPSVWFGLLFVCVAVIL